MLHVVFLILWLLLLGSIILILLGSDSVHSELFLQGARRVGGLKGSQATGEGVPGKEKGAFGWPPPIVPSKGVGTPSK
jgi:hypothetical protein